MKSLRAYMAAGVLTLAVAFLAVFAQPSGKAIAQHSAAPVYGDAVKGIRLGISAARPIPGRGEIVSVYVLSNSSIAFDQILLLSDFEDAFRVTDANGVEIHVRGAGVVNLNTVVVDGIAVQHPPEFLVVHANEPAVFRERPVIARSLRPGQYSVTLGITLHLVDGTAVTLRSGTLQFKL